MNEVDEAIVRESGVWGDFSKDQAIRQQLGNVDEAKLT